MNQAISELSYSDFRNILQNAQQRANIRLMEVSKMANIGRVGFFGFGGKGRGLASHIRATSNVELIIYDSDPAVRARALAEGFDVVEDLYSIQSSEGIVILGACQSQLEQAREVGARAVFFKKLPICLMPPILQTKYVSFLNG
ncbi:hypothetical protein [Cyanobium sp. ATX-6F1]|uniref:hypothetical protein n=1 Tax=Cyanobium sp. ATX-6F1 TaxID=3137388 RepID=UPI0039BE6E18